MIKTIRRAIAILLVATAVILLVLPASDVNATYTKGDYVIDGGTLVSYTGTESDITIPLGITSIGKDAFSGNNTLTKVYIPDEVTSIDYAAFENCKNLQKVSIGDGVKSIGSSAFSGCKSLTDINIPRYTETIGSGTFAACPSLTDIDVDPKNRHFVCLDGVLYSKDGHKLYQYLAGRPYSIYDIPEPVKEIGEFGFYGANMLTTVGVVPGVEEIPEYAFLNCTALNKVELPGTIKAIRKGAFGGCSNLTKLKVPTSCGMIDPEAFTSMDGVKGDVVNEATGEVLSKSNLEPGGTNAGFVVSEDSPSDDEQNQNTNNSTDNASKSEEQNASTEQTMSDLANDVANTLKIGVEGALETAEDAINSVTSNELASTTIVGGEAVFLLDPKEMKVKGFDINAAQTEDSIADSGNSSSSGEDIRSYSGQEFDVIDGNFGHYGKNESNISIPQNVTKIGNRVFYNNKNIENVSLPSAISEIGDFAFARSSLKSIDIPDGTEHIGYAAFYNCSDLENVSVPSSVKEIELGAFDNTAFINNWRNIEDGNNFLVLGDGILVAYKGHSTNVEIPGSVKTIGPSVFAGNNRIQTVHIPDTVKKISEDAFNGCRKLTEIDLPNALETVEDRAFKNTGLKLVQVPAAVRGIGLGAFDTVDVNGGVETVIFKGSYLPDTTYKPTATRLSAEGLRTNAFNGTQFAFVPSGVNMSSGTIFDPNTYGFRGLVFSNGTKDPNGNQNLELRKCTVEPDKDGKVKLNDNIFIARKMYYLSGVSDTAFDEYKSPDWCQNKLTEVSLNGDNSQALDDLLSDLNYSVKSGSNTGVGNYGDAIKIKTDGSINSLYCNATLPSTNEKFNMTIKQDISLKPAFEKAFDNRYGNHSGVVAMDTYSIDMSDRLNSVPIKKMATNKLNITMPLPAQFDEADNIQVATLDDNGLLEEVSGTVNEMGDGTKNVSFVASHLSPFAFYIADGSMIQNIDGIADEEASEKIDEEASSDGEITLIEESVTTEQALSEGKENKISQTVIYGTLQKEVAPGIPVRYMIAVIMIALAGILFFYKKRGTRRA